MTSCAACGAPLPQEPPSRCPAPYCGFPLGLPEAGELREIRERLDALRAEMDPLLARRAEILRLARAAAAASRPELDARRARTLLLGLGASLLGIAALIFTVVSWGRLGLPAKAAVLTGLAALALYLPWPLARRGLTATGEALSALGLLLLVLEGYAAFSYGLFDGVPGDWYTAFFALFLALGWTAYAKYSPLRTPLPVAVVVLQFPLPLLAYAYDDAVPYPFVAALLADGALTLFVLRRTARRASSGSAAAGLSFALVILTAYAAGNLHQRDEQLKAALFLAAVAVLARLWSREHRFFGVPAGLAAVLAVAFPLQDLLPRAHAVTAFSLAALIPLLATARGGRWHGATAMVRGVSWAFLAASGLFSLYALAATLLGPERTVPGPVPIVLGLIALGMAAERLRPAATVFAALALHAVAPALAFGDEAVRDWQTAVVCLLIVLAAALRESVAETLLALLLLVCLPGPPHLGPQAVLLLLLTAGGAAARNVPARLMLGIAAALWSGVVVFDAVDRLGWTPPPETFTLPVALAGLLLGLGWRKRAGSSWLAYAPGLAVLLGPSLLLMLDQDGWTRPLLLGAAALAVCLAGVRLGLQAPAVLGGLALLLDAAHQTAPYVRDAVTALPQWIPIAAAGVLLLSLGATYERHIRRARSLYSRLSAMH
ncbi:SCO7613 C-terminal domain-containing membrane protein [Actinocorallia populi]|uniref:SCO7613 C-terminal domain-containing membrane protein n=1 Tax=Actinocorallia populi TaxID=2079200 RepID=UPI000D093099|nr:hypothetical protein [Actinocorallia populi]